MGAEALSGAGSSQSPRSGAGRSGAGRSGAGRPGRAKVGRPGSGQAKSGKPRPGTGGYGRRALEGKGPTPPAVMRPGHPAQRRAAAASASGGSRGRRQDDGPASGGSRGRRQDDGPASGGSRGRRQDDGRASSFTSWGPSARAPRGAGDAAEFVAGRNSVVESLRAGVPSAALYVGSRVQHDERISEAIKLAADRGIAVLEAGAAELDRLTGGALHQGLALRVRPYDYAHPDDLLTRAADAGQRAADRRLGRRHRPAQSGRGGAFGGRVRRARGGRPEPSRCRRHGGCLESFRGRAGPRAGGPRRQPGPRLQSYQDAGVFVAGLHAAGDTEIRDLELATAPLVVVIGSEGRGLSRIVGQTCDVLVRIPIAARTESLNAGVAAGIALYEVASRRASKASAVGALREFGPSASA